MAERLLKAGHDVSIWNRTRAKAEPLAKSGGKIVDKLADLAGCDVVFSIVSTGKDLEEVYFGKHGVVHGRNGKQKYPPLSWRREQQCRQQNGGGWPDEGKMRVWESKRLSDQRAGIIAGADQEHKQNIT